METYRCCRIDSMMSQYVSKLESEERIVQWRIMMLMLMHLLMQMLMLRRWRGRACRHSRRGCRRYCNSRQVLQGCCLCRCPRIWRIVRWGASGGCWCGAGSVWSLLLVLLLLLRTRGEINCLLFDVFSLSEFFMCLLWLSSLVVFANCCNSEWHLALDFLMTRVIKKSILQSSMSEKVDVYVQELQSWSSFFGCKRHFCV